MPRVLGPLGGMVVLGFSMLGAAGSSDAANPPTVKAIMGKANKGSDSLFYGIRQDLKDDEPDWPEIQKSAKELVRLLNDLGKNDPPQGQKDSWARLARAYLENARALQAAAGKQDRRAANAAVSKIEGSCTGCHKVHRGN
jgi:hypothetical protein